MDQADISPRPVGTGADQRASALAAVLRGDTDAARRMLEADKQAAPSCTLPEAVSRASRGGPPALAVATDVVRALVSRGVLDGAALALEIAIEEDFSDIIDVLVALDLAEYRTAELLGKLATWAAKKDQARIVEFALARIPRPWPISTDMLEHAVVSDHTATVVKLVQYGADVSRLGVDAIRSAARKGYVGTIKALLASPEGWEREAVIIHLIAAPEMHPRVALLLADRGALGAKKALAHVVAARAANCARELYAHVPAVTALIAAIRLADADAVRAALARVPAGERPTARHDVLHALANCGSAEIVALLLLRDRPTPSENTSLYVAAAAVAAVAAAIFLKMRF